MTQDNLIHHFRQEFFQEAREILENISNDILKLEATPENEELLNAVFRGIHTIKGSAGSFELMLISDFTHHLEGLLNALRDKKIVLTSNLVDVILSGSDEIAGMIDLSAKGKTPELNHDLIERIKDCLPGEGIADDGREAPGKLDLTANQSGTGVLENKPFQDFQSEVSLIIKEGTLPDEKVHAFQKEAAEGRNIFKITLKYTTGHFENGYDPLVFLKNLHDNSSLYHVELGEPNPVPGLKTFEALHLYLDPVIYVATAGTRDEILDLVFDEGLISVENLAEKGSAGSTAMDSMGKGLMNDIIRSPEAMAEFIDGAVDMLQTAEKAVMAYESNASAADLDELFRVVHNIKGDADLMGFTDLVKFAHAFESVLDLLRLKKLSCTPEITEIALQSVDFIKTAVAEISGARPVPPLGGLYDSIRKLQGQESGDLSCSEVYHGAEPVFIVVDDELAQVYQEQMLQFKSILMQCMENQTGLHSQGLSLKRTLQDIVRASAGVGHESAELSARNVLAAIAQCRDDILSDGFLDPVFSAMEELMGEPKKIGEILIAEGKIKEEDLDLALSKQKRMSSVLKQKEEDSQPGIKTMRVDEQKVEAFSNLVGEMLIARNTYAYLLNRLITDKNENKVAETIKDFKENLHLFSRLTNDVQHGVVSLRMIPVRGIFEKFSRVVRDISRKQNKMIQLFTDGEDIEIDKKVADALSDPLVHVIRNSCDHGIETPVERKRANKPEKGTVLLKASREGSNILIRINDDGRGINREKLFEKATQQGLSFSSADDPKLLDMIFMPGLSTAEEITDVSGRGVGMDVVKTTVQSLGGTVSVMSERGQGTQLTLTIPTSMGIDTVLFVEADKNSYAIPINYIMETMKVSPKTFIRAGNQLMFYHRGEVLSAHFLADLLNVDEDDNARNAKGHEVHPHPGMKLRESGFGGDETAGIPVEVSLVVIKTSNNKYGVIIDRFDKNMEIAVKPLPNMLSGLDVISGISILGDGRVLLVINPEQLDG